MTSIKLNKDIDDKKLKYYFYEIYMVWSRRKNKNVNTIFKYDYKSLLERFVVSILAFIFVSGILFYSGINIVTAICYAILILVNVLVFLSIKRVNDSLKQSKKYKGKRTLLLDDKTLTSTIEKSVKISIEWTHINYLLVGPYSMTFIPINPDYNPVSLPIEYKEELLDAISKEYKDLKIYDCSVMNK